MITKEAKVFMQILGVIIGLIAVAFPLVTIFHALGIPHTEAHWGVWAGLFGMLFAGLISVEMFTGNITKYAGKLVQALAERLAGKVGGDK